MKSAIAYSLAIIGSVLLIIGYLFRIMHWAYGSELMMGGLVLAVTGGGIYLYLGRKGGS